MYRFVNLLASLSLLLNTFSYPAYALAQEITDTPTEAPQQDSVTEPTPTIEATVVSEEQSPTESVEPTPTETIGLSDPEDLGVGGPSPTIVVDETAITEPQTEVLLIEGTQPSTESALLQPDLTESQEESSATLNPSVSTDKADYAPTETVTLTGTDFPANSELSLKVTWPDGVVRSSDGTVDATDSVMTDDAGSFVFFYDLRGEGQEGEYQVAILLGTDVLASTIFTDSHISSHLCTTDTAGANDQPGQKDLTQMCADYSGLNTSIGTDWNWDDTAWSGSNTGDACALFDNDGDGLANYASCVTVTDDPAVQASNSPRLYTCNDTRNDRCAGKVLITGPYTTTCYVNQTADQPFPVGDDTPNDTKATCTIMLSEVGGESDTVLIDVCSFPSEEPNSDPSDCIIARTRAGRIEVVKNLIPDTDTGLFNLLIGGTAYASNVGDSGTTGEISLSVSGSGGAVYSVSETAGTGTNLSGYSTSIECRDVNGTGSVVASSSSTSVNVTLNDQDDIVCIITNELDQGDLTVIKHVVGGTAVAGDWTLNVKNAAGADAVTPFPGAESPGTTNELAEGTYYVTETGGPAGYTLTYSGACNSQGEVTVTAGQTSTCTLTNTRDTGTITVNKVVDPSTDTGLFNLLIDGSPEASDVGNGGTTGAVTVYSGLHSISETAGTGTSLSDYDTTVFCGTDNPVFGTSLSDIQVDKDENVVCTFTNTLKRGSIFGYKYHDKDADGIFNNNDVVLTDWTIDITGPNAYSNSDDTDVDGRYDFTNLLPGTYTVCEDLESGYTQVAPVSNNGCYEVVVDPGQSEGPYNFYNFQNIKISGFKFEDLDGDGVWDLGEPPLDGWTINLGGAGNQTALTGDGVWADGYYEFSDLGPGDYEVFESLLTGWIQTYGDTTYYITAEGGQNETDKNFGNFELVDISGYKYNDLNADGDLDSEDLLEPLSGWQINLYLNDIFQSSVVTNSSGYYEFLALGPGTYKLTETLIAGWTQSYPSSPDYYEFDLVSGSDVTERNFANWTQGTIEACKYDELQRAVQGWEMEVTGGNLQNPLTSDTEADGCVDFEVDPGTYTVTEEDNSGWVHVTPANGEITGVVVESDHTTTVNFYNERKASLTIIKYNDLNGDGDDETGTDPRLEGWHFSVYEGDCQTPGDLAFGGSTDSNGELSSLVPAGTYCAVEDDSSHAGWISTTSTQQEVVLGANDSNTLLFGNFELGEISGKKFNDLNGDHQWVNTTDDPNLPGWTIRLDVQGDSNPPNCPSGSVNGEYCETTTNASGNYKFDGLYPGTYIVSEVQQAGWVQTRPDATYGGLGHQADGTYILTIGSGDSIDSRLFGNQGRGSIKITKIVDPIDNSLWDFDVTEPSYGSTFVPAVDITLGNSANMQWTDLPAGEYSIDEEIDDDYVTTFDCGNFGNGQGTSVTFDLNAGDNVECTFTNSAKPGVISGYKYKDNDGDGGKDTPLANWTIFIDENGDQILDLGEESTTTDSSGYYEFVDLPSGETYDVCEVIELGYYQTTPGTESAPECYQVTMTPNGLFVDIDFTNSLYSSIGDYIWEDIDADGVQDAGEPALGGISVYLYKDDGDGIYEPGTDDVLIGTETSDNGTGLYLFEGLVAGMYWVWVDASTAPVGYILTTTDLYGPIAVAGGDMHLDADFGFVNPVKEIRIVKDNDHPNANAGDTVNYKLTVTNTGQVVISNLDVIDVMPIEFSYVSGSTKIDGSASSDPSISSNVLTWSVGSLAPDESLVIEYQAKISDDADEQTYINLATCKGMVGSLLRISILDQINGEFEGETINCNVDDSSVTIGEGTDPSAGINPQVLGISTELPATGSDTTLLIFALSTLALGLILKSLSLKLNTEKAKK